MSRFTRRKAAIAEIEAVISAAFPWYLRLYRWVLTLAYQAIQRRLARARTFKQMKKWHGPGAWVEERLVKHAPPGRRETFQRIVRRHGLTPTERWWLWRSMLVRRA